MLDLYPFLKNPKKDLLFFNYLTKVVLNFEDKKYLWKYLYDTLLLIWPFLTIVLCI